MAIRKSKSGSASSTPVAERSPVLFVRDQFGSDIGFIALSEANIKREAERKLPNGKSDPRGVQRAETLKLHRALALKGSYEQGQVLKGLTAAVYLPGVPRKAVSLEDRMAAAEAHMAALKAEAAREAAVA